MVVDTYKIIIFKGEVYQQIEAITQKHQDASLSSADLRSADAHAADMEQPVDSLVLHRYVDFRHARIRKKLRCAIIQDPRTMFNEEGRVIFEREGITASDDLRPEVVYTYDFSNMAGHITGETVEWLAIHIHEYLVRGALYDWYKSIGNFAQAKAYDNIDELEDEISTSLQEEGLVMHKPMPLWPSYRTR